MAAVEGGVVGREGGRVTTKGAVDDGSIGIAKGVVLDGGGGGEKRGEEGIGGSKDLSERVEYRTLVANGEAEVGEGGGGGGGEEESGEVTSGGVGSGGAEGGGDNSGS
uniref:Glycine-rich cell wall structural protein 1.0-like n=1 Tax=Elaeis guineensis var. tenera TaxID=51953 RepID=A0A8N4IDN0_ELAGV|nr:glycine-rich cell wall structural protein 1.0-like [Elaeis guineensis]